MAEPKNTRIPREGPRLAGESLTEGSAGDSSSTLPPVCPVYTRGASNAISVAATATTARRPLHPPRTTDPTDLDLTHRKPPDTTPARLPPRDSAGRFVSRPSSSTKKYKDSEDYSSEDDIRIPSGIKRSRSLRTSDLLSPEPEGEPLRKEKPSARGKNKKTGSTRPRSKPGRTEYVEEEEALTKELHKAFGRDAPMSTATSEEEQADETANLVIPDLRSLGPEQLRALGGKASAAILWVAAKSRHLKGTFVKRLKNSANLYTCVVAELTARQEDEENQRLRGQLALQQRRIEALETELKAHRLEFARFRAGTSKLSSIPVPSNPDKEISMQELQASLTRSLGEMIEARLAGIESKLLPQPPSAVGSSKETSCAPAKIKSKQTNPSAAQAGPSQATVAASPAPVPSGAPGEESWATVVKKKKKPTKGSAQSVASPAPAAAPQVQQRKKKKRKPRKRKLAERSPALILKLDPEAEKKGVTYAKVLTAAQNRIDLQSLGIGAGMRIRRSATGARVLSFPKSQCPLAVKRLGEKIDEAVGGRVIVELPQNLVTLRLTGLAETVKDGTEVAEAIVRATGSCTIDEIEVGELWGGRSGMAAAHVRCAIPVAKKLAEMGRLQIGWCSARVHLLERRPMRCFRCMSLGHTGAVCPTGVDRSRLCFRCGKTGHQAMECRASLHCAVCSAANRPSAHYMGGRNCVPPKVKKKPAAVSEKTAPSEPASRALDEEEQAAMSP